MKTETDVLVVGAGAAGLTAGHLLTRAGRGVQVIDRKVGPLGGGGLTASCRGHAFELDARAPSGSRAIDALRKEILPDGDARSGGWEAAARAMRANGGAVHWGESLESARWDVSGRIWIVTVKDEEGERRTVTANHLVSSATLADLTAALKPTPICRLHARRLPRRDILMVALFTGSPSGPPDGDLEVQAPGLAVAKVRAVRALEGMKGLGCLVLEYPCSEGDDLWNAGDEALIALARREIGAMGLIEAEACVDACVVRKAKASPAEDEESPHNLQMIRLDLQRSFPTLQVIGRGGTHRAHGQDEAMMTAVMAVGNILDGQRVWDVWRVGEDAEYAQTACARVLRSIGESSPFTRGRWTAA